MSTSKGHEAGESDGRGVVEHLEVELADVRRLLQDTERSYESRVWELEQQMSHLLAHGQNRNQYTGSEPIPHRQGLQSYTDANHDKYYFCSCGTVHPEWYWNPDDWHHKVWGLEQKPTTPKPQQHVHERFKLIYSEDMREIALRVCEDCGYADTEDYWRGWEARGVHDAIKQ